MERAHVSRDAPTRLALRARGCRRRVERRSYFSARFTISARQEVKNATLVLDPGWVEGMSVNTIEPSPLGEGSHDGKLVLELGHIPAGQKHVLWMQFQVNPTNVAWHRPAGVTLLDGSKTLTHIDRRYTIYP